MAIHKGERPSPVREGEVEQRDAGALAPDLYAIAESGPVAFQHIAQARRIRQLRKEYAPQSRELEQLLRTRFVQQLEEPIVSEYYCVRAYGGCALTDSGRIYSVLNTYVSDLVEIEGAIKQLNRDALRLFVAKRGLTHDRDAQVREIGETLYSVMTRVMATADLLAEPPPAEPAKGSESGTTAESRAEALVALHREWEQARTRAMALIQREARFEYFTGVLIGVVVAICVFSAVAAVAAQYWPDQVATASFLASTLAGAIGAAVSVTQRMAAGTLVLDYTASRQQKLVIGAARPVVGSVFACVVQFALLGGLLTMQSTSQSEQTPATFAFFAVIGFASGFSERLATDILERAGSVLTAAPSPTGSEAPAGRPPAAGGAASTPPPTLSEAKPQ